MNFQAIRHFFFNRITWFLLPILEEIRSGPFFQAAMTRKKVSPFQCFVLTLEFFVHVRYFQPKKVFLKNLEIRINIYPNFILSISCFLSTWSKIKKVWKTLKSGFLCAYLGLKKATLSRPIYRILMSKFRLI